MTTLYDFIPDHREAIAKVESLRRMRDVTAEWRAHFSSTPVAGSVRVPSPLANASVAGTYREKAA